MGPQALGFVFTFPTDDAGLQADFNKQLSSGHTSVGNIAEFVEKAPWWTIPMRSKYLNQMN